MASHRGRGRSRRGGLRRQPGSAPSSPARIDGHAHLSGLEGIARLVRSARAAGLERMNLACLWRAETVNANPEAFVAKAEHPELFYVFGGLDHCSCISGGRVGSPPLAAQVDRLAELGADGIKMIETKPTSRKVLDVPADSDYFEGLFSRLEERSLPLLWHVADPEEFWDPVRVPAWARKAGWFYDGSFVPKETLYAEVERVLERHPRLVVIFAHFLFLSADLARAGAFLDAHGRAHLDLAPGWELLYNMSRDPERSREFFVKYADRIVYGTDISSGMRPQAAAELAGAVARWLSTADTFRESPDYGVLRGLSLPEDVLAKIFRGNFERIAGARPRPLRREIAREECERIAAELDALGRPGPHDAVRLAARRLGRPA